MEFQVFMDFLKALMGDALDHTAAGDHEGCLYHPYLHLLTDAPAFTPFRTFDEYTVADYTGYAPVHVTSGLKYISQDGRVSVDFAATDWRPGDGDTPNNIVGVLITDDAIGTKMLAVATFDPVTLQDALSLLRTCCTIRLPKDESWGEVDPLS